MVTDGNGNFRREWQPDDQFQRSATYVEPSPQSSRSETVSLPGLRGLDSKTSACHLDLVAVGLIDPDPEYSVVEYLCLRPEHAAALDPDPLSGLSSFPGAREFRSRITGFAPD
jgi:hypothetical protein